MASLDCHDALGEARARPRRPGQSEGERACRERPPGSREKRTSRRACLSGEEQANPTAVTQHRQAPRNGAPCPGRYIGRSGDQSDELRPARSLGASTGVNRPGAPAVRPGHGPGPSSGAGAGRFTDIWPLFADMRPALRDAPHVAGLRPRLQVSSILATGCATGLATAAARTGLATVAMARMRSRSLKTLPA